jgi:hypothetical protein
MWSSGAPLRGAIEGLRARVGRCEGATRLEGDDVPVVRAGAVAAPCRACDGSRGVSYCRSAVSARALTAPRARSTSSIDGAGGARVVAPPGRIPSRITPR